LGPFVSGYFLDTSALAKLYHREDGSQYVERLVGVRGSSTIISRLSLVEMESVLAIKVRTGELDVGGRELARRRLRADVAQGRIRLGPTIEERHYRNARNLLARYGVERGLRTLDAIQLAVALGLRELGLVSVFVAADQRLCRAAEDCDFSTVDPTNPGLVIG
jgi:predicted nucleic acid-binding protein